MEPTQKELTLEESIKQVMQTLPPVVRAYLAQGKYTVVAKSLMAKYGLRIDQAGVLEREIMLLLMGIENPDEFTQTLIEEAKLEQKTIDSIVQDINTQIFMPLRAEEMKAPHSVVPALTPAPTTAGIPRLVVPTAPPKATQGTATAPTQAQPEKFFHLQNKIAPPSPRPANPGLRGVLAAVANPADARKMLEDHEEPHIEFKTPEMPKNLPGALPPVAVPKAAPQSAPIQPRTVAPGARFIPLTPQAVTPAASIPEVRPSFAIPKVEPQKPVAPTPSVPPAPSAAPKPYTADPYREPIEP
ncbi:MAG: hypothetical protein PHD04_02795 [Candidatus Pacebacteria bacterium]|nr:hypothetical protein [Candidatus Paceibacterota bacterium]